MFFFFFEDDIPDQLRFKSYTDSDINILIGENGTGKSSLLNVISKFYLKRTDANVIAIANTIYDKFNARNTNFNILRASQGKSLVKKTIMNSLELLASENSEKLRNVALTLEYAGFDPSVTIEIIELKLYYRDVIEESELSSNEKEKLITFLDSFVREGFEQKRTFTINFFKNNFTDIKQSYYLQIFFYEKILKKLKIIKEVKILFSKENRLIPVENASSGELTIITTLIFITLNITENSVILIDEPENSLHPKWQIEYIKNLSDLYYFYQPKIIIATHSPLIINGKDMDVSKMNVFKGTRNGFILHQENTKNVEEIYEDYFNLTTPENRYVSEFAVNKLNELADKKVTSHEFRQSIIDIQKKSYDGLQKTALDGVLEMGNEIIKELK